MNRIRMQAAQQPASMSKVGMQGWPSNTQADAIAHLHAGRLGEAAAILRQIVATNPDNWQSLHLLGLTAYRQGSLEDAVSYLRRCLDVKLDLAEAHSDLGVVLKELGQLEEARTCCATAVALKPSFFPAYSNLGNVLKELGLLEDAAAAYRKAILLAPHFAEAHANLGTLLVSLGEPEAALVHCQNAADLAPEVGEMHTALGHALRHNHKFEEALAAFRTAIDLKPTFAPAYTDLGCLLQEIGQYEAALHAHERALMLQPDFADAHNNIGVVLKSLGRFEEARDAYKRAVAFKPGCADAYSNLGIVLDQLGDHGEAEAAFKVAIDLAPWNVQHYLNLAGSLLQRNRIKDAAAIHAKLLKIAPDHHAALASRYSLRRNICEWRDLSTIEDALLEHTYREGKPIPPAVLLNVGCDAEEQLLCAREWVKNLPYAIEKPFTYHSPRTIEPNTRLRVGYLSGDFNEHPTASLITELLERHDRKRFDVYGYCYSRDDKSATRHRITNAFEHFVQVGPLSHAEAASRIHADEIDVLVDLKGLTADARTEIMACRPAPIQVNFLGYSGTMGAEFIDYIVADPFILPMNKASYLDEKIVHLPGCYQPNDTRRPMAAETPSRADYGLPEESFVYCCFNATYKITPQMFAVWMRLLKAMPGSVLWLMESNSMVRGNLCREAEAHGVGANRIVFAPKTPQAKHLARHRLADLFLDTLPINANTAASDALWVGLPLLTCAGSNFVSRVSGSVLNAAGVPELVTKNLEDYEAMALKLAREPGALAAIGARLARERVAATPLFNIDLYRRNLEAAFEYMAELRAAGYGPRAFAVADVAGKKPEPAQPPLVQVLANPEVAAAALAAAEKAAEKQAAMPKPKVRIKYEACPLCGSKEIDAHKEADCTGHPCYTNFLPSVVAWNRCGDCGHVFTEGFFSPEATAVIFSRQMQQDTAGHDVPGQRVLSARIIEQVAMHTPKPTPVGLAEGKRNFTCGDWLDVGFGNASLIFTAEEWGFRTCGLDLRTDNVQALEQLGFEAYCKPIDELDFNNRFTVVSMSQVLQHMPYPKAALKAAHRLLQPNGVLFLSMPNMDTVAWRTMDTAEENPYWGELEHYHNFSRARLYTLLEEHGFTPVAYNVSDRFLSCMEVIAVRAEIAVAAPTVPAAA